MAQLKSGTTVGGDFTVDTNTLHVDATNNRVGIGTSSPSVKLHASGADEQIFQISKTASGTPAMKVNGGYIITEGGNYGIRGGAGTAMYVGSNNADRAMFTTDGYMRFLAGTGGIQFNGDTAAANALDDYEEGTWTPTAKFAGTSASGWTTNGRYTKIGRLVFISGYAWAGSIGSGVFEIHGLPYASTGSHRKQSIIGHYGFPALDNGWISSRIASTQSKMQFIHGNEVTEISDTHMNADEEIYFSMSYEAS